MPIRTTESASQRTTFRPMTSSRLMLARTRCHQAAATTAETVSLMRGSNIVSAPRALSRPGSNRATLHLRPPTVALPKTTTLAIPRDFKPTNRPNKTLLHSRVDRAAGLLPWELDQDLGLEITLILLRM